MTQRLVEGTKTRVLLTDRKCEVERVQGKENQNEEG